MLELSPRLDCLTKQMYFISSIPRGHSSEPDMAQIGGVCFSRVWVEWLSAIDSLCYIVFGLSGELVNLENRRSRLSKVGVTLIPLVYDTEPGLEHSLLENEGGKKMCDETQGVVIPTALIGKERPHNSRPSYSLQLQMWKIPLLKRSRVLTWE